MFFHSGMEGVHCPASTKPKLIKILLLFICLFIYLFLLTSKWKLDPSDHMPIQIPLFTESLTGYD